MLFPAKEFAQDTESNVSPLAGLKVLIADDHALVREGLKLSLTHIAQDATVLEAETLGSAVETYRSCPAIDLVLLDLCMPGAHDGSALDGFVESCPDARIVIVSATYDMKTVQSAMAKGVLGFIPKRAGKSAFINALRFVLEGGIYIPPEALLPQGSATPASIAPAERTPAAAAPQAPTAADSPRNARLTARQIDVLAQLLDGKPNKQICRELNLALGTVKCHVGAILGALEVNTRAEAIAAANKRGWRQWLAQPRMDQRQAA
jgi:DNA-binding NarL/FixJ family response regulator